MRQKGLKVVELDELYEQERRLAYEKWADIEEDLDLIKDGIGQRGVKRVCYALNKEKRKAMDSFNAWDISSRFYRMKKEGIC